MLLAHKAEEKPIPVGQAHEGQGRADDCNYSEVMSRASTVSDNGGWAP
jgi:hypothetical protein